MEDEGVCLTGEEDIKNHIYNFYKGLFGADHCQKVTLADDFWLGNRTISEADNEILSRTFTDKEVWDVIRVLPADSAPGPDGFPTSFYKVFWGGAERSLYGDGE